MPTFINKTFAQHSSAATYIDLFVPSSTLNRDIMLASIQINGSAGGGSGSIGTITEPAGWTALFENGNDGNGNGLWYRVVTATPEPASYRWNWATNRGYRFGAIFTYRDGDVASPIDGSAQATDALGPPYTAPSIIPVHSSTLVLAIGHILGAYTGGPLGTPVDHTVRFGCVDAYPGFHVADKTFPSAGSTGAADFPDGDADISTRLYRVALAPGELRGAGGFISVAIE